MRSSHVQLIRLRLRELAQLFNSMDPSPFVERDLDAKAEEYIVSSARELAATAELELVIHLEVQPPEQRGAETEAAVQHYFTTRAELKLREFRQLMRRGRISLVVGLSFLIACLAISELLGTLGQSTASAILRESLTIGGWVAMWRPLEIYLYDWWPLRDERRVMERLSRMRVKMELPQSSQPRSM
jgi:hypothetical protein